MGADLSFVIMGDVPELAVYIVLLAQRMLLGMLLDSSAVHLACFLNMGLWSYYDTIKNLQSDC